MAQGLFISADDKTDFNNIHAIDVIREIRRTHTDHFEIVILGFPSLQTLHGVDLHAQLENIKAQVDAGASLILTDIFYDVDLFISWVHLVRKVGIMVPIIPSVAPIRSWNGLMRTISLSKAIVPTSFLHLLEPHRNDDQKIQRIGAEIVADICVRILDAEIGVCGFNFDTMNLARPTSMVLANLQLSRYFAI